MATFTRKKFEGGSGGFTLIEIIMVVVILGIAALAVVPMLSSAADIQVRTAANMIAADLEYAKNMAITQQKNYSVVFDIVNETYEIRDDTATVIGHPVNVGRDFVVDFANDGRLDQVDIALADFDPGSELTVTFDYLGGPYSGGDPLNAGSVDLQAGTFTMTVTVEPVTGYVKIQ